MGDKGLIVLVGSRALRIDFRARLAKLLAVFKELEFSFAR